MVVNKIDNIQFRLKEHKDFLWIKEYGIVFQVIDETASGCICFGLINEDKKYFLKIAGANTIEAEVTPKESIATLKEAVKLYKILQHPNLIKLVDHYPYKQYYVAVFEWADGECLFDHWNFENYSKNPQLVRPYERFKKLSIKKKLDSIEVIFSFLESVANKNYVAVDFYDGSIMYDFKNDKTTICDIDFFRKKPTINNVGENFWGTKRLKSPEEYIYGACIDECTNVFNLGAMIFNFFGEFSQQDIQKRYIDNMFLPCSLENWTLNKQCYDVVSKAVSLERNNRYKTILDFKLALKMALDIEKY